MPAGRPTDYRPEFCEQATNYCLLGATDKELASFFDICEATLNKWKNEHPEFMEALKAGREKADCNVARSLYKRACGDSEHPAETTAAIFWLKNRRRKDWREKQEVELTTIEPVIIKDQDGSKIMELSSRQRPEEKRSV